MTPQLAERVPRTDAILAALHRHGPAADIRKGAVRARPQHVLLEYAWNA